VIPRTDRKKASHFPTWRLLEYILDRFYMSPGLSWISNCGSIRVGENANAKKINKNGRSNFQYHKTINVNITSFGRIALSQNTRDCPKFQNSGSIEVVKKPLYQKEKKKLQPAASCQYPYTLQFWTIIGSILVYFIIPEISWWLNFITQGVLKKCFATPIRFQLQTNNKVSNKGV